MMVLMRQTVSCDMLDHMVMTDKTLLVVKTETADALADVVDTVFCSTDAGRSKQVGIQDTNINAGTQDDDSEFECDEQAIVVPSFPSNRFLSLKVNTVCATIENHLDYVEELARLQRQEHEAHSAAEKKLVLAVGDPAGSIVSTGGIPACSIPAGSILARSVPAGGVLAGSVDSAGCGDLAISESVHAVFNLVYANNSTLPPVPLPNGKIAIGTKWIMKNRRVARGIVVRNKSRLVAQGHRQEDGTDYDEVFAPVARIEAIKLFLAFASYMGFMVYQMDVKSAFLYGEIKEEVKII
nr:copia protein [Tanacetum cinerariifolium]